MPTLLDMFEIEKPPSIQGESFAGMFAGRNEKQSRSFYIESMYGKETLGWAPLAGIIDGLYKYISLPEPELYDLKNDRGEKINLFLQKKNVARDLDEKLKKLMLEYSASRASTRRELTAEDRRRLESLGYISSSSPGASRAIDPKKGIVLLNQFNSANNLIEKGLLDSAEVELKRIVAQGPGIDILPYFELMAKVYELRSDHEAALENWKEAVRVFPTNKRFQTAPVGTIGGGREVGPGNHGNR
jgi:tetratricopeptide (TPR) repeat protein